MVRVPLQKAVGKKRSRPTPTQAIQEASAHPSGDQGPSRLQSAQAERVLSPTGT